MEPSVRRFVDLWYRLGGREKGLTGRLTHDRNDNAESLKLYIAGAAGERMYLRSRMRRLSSHMSHTLDRLGRLAALRTLHDIYACCNKAI